MKLTADTRLLLSPSFELVSQTFLDFQNRVFESESEVDELRELVNSLRG